MVYLLNFFAVDNVRKMSATVNALFQRWDLSLKKNVIKYLWVNSAKLNA